MKDCNLYFIPDWQALIRARDAAKSKPNLSQQKPLRKLTKSEKKRQKMQKQMEQVEETMKKKNVQTIVYNNPDSRSTKESGASARNLKEKSEECQPDEGIELDMRKARHEIIKFGMTSLKSKDLEDAEASLAISLGARPKKKAAINYKELQAQRKKEKQLEKETESNLSKPDLKTIGKKKGTPKGKKGQQKSKEGRPHGHGRSNNPRKFSKPNRSRKS